MWRVGPVWIAAPLAVSVATAPSVGFAQVSVARRAACTPDVLHWCSGDVPNVSRIRTCLRRERMHLSSACQEVLNAVERRE